MSDDSSEETSDRDDKVGFTTSERVGERESLDEVPEYEGQWVANSAPESDSIEDIDTDSTDSE
ncbi:hypothetical protein KI372_07480 [Halobacterium salinarum]|uniref:hypothetical protein n=1 Tax=Halobacterium salinarum TaxID=2242 RepID=UPI001F3EAD9D|nr:hypothetical protein [Halobacterium salinarum]MCF2207881.1 hypothetical protein [Halobacterium salinarum]MCF2241210.1 hypothetical protein [Halobacterium salinarum]